MKKLIKTKWVVSILVFLTLGFLFFINNYEEGSVISVINNIFLTLMTFSWVLVLVVQKEIENNIENDKN
jgi:hypothetical protein